MSGFPIDLIVALIGIAVPIVAFVWEFVLVGRRRLGYRVQMDTPVTGEIDSVFPGVLPQLRPDENGRSPELKDLSVVLFRIENSGITTIDPADYAVPDDVRVGLHLHFPQRRVIGMAVTELSDPGLGEFLDGTSGIAVREDPVGQFGIIDLPKVQLNRGDHYKILAILQRSSGVGEYPNPQLRGRLRGGRVAESRSRTGVSKFMVGLTAFLAVVIAVQFAVGALDSPSAPEPLDCATGKLTLVGSTTFEPLVRQAADSYRKRCAGAEFDFAMAGSGAGLDRLDEQGKGNPGLLAITDGPKGVGYPTLLSRPLASALYGVIVHKDVGVRELTVAQIRDLYAGRVVNWNQVGGADLPVRLVNRMHGSGTRDTFEHRMLDEPQPLYPAATCREIRYTAPPSPAHCEVASTKDMLAAVAETPGAIGYSEFADAAKASGITTVAIDGHAAGKEAVLDRTYPFWGVEFAYSNGDLPADSLAAGFLRYLTDQGGKDVLRAAGALPCADLPNPALCQPVS
ncbi:MULTISPECIES: substrate-binding domain-containing protein [unclassified Nocardia]|uniref:substrate-binding domain-containing protein n=1 Tax=unclassified Nocardia TaxID=2637762 RepID=UPI001CE421B0|nr:MULTISPECIES: substrate-binding domain-containing protein [unclassified Nocardia]